MIKLTVGFKQYSARNELKWNDVLLKVRIYCYGFFLRKVFKIGVIITTCGFIITWTPYAVVLFVSAFRGKDYALPPLVTFSCACVAKTSVIWIPMLYMGTSTQFRFQFVNQDAGEQVAPTNRVNATIMHRKNYETEMHPAPGNIDGQRLAINNDH